MKKAIDIISEIATKTSEVILFHSLSGKDSITLLDLLYPRFNKIVCAYMYIVKDLSHINRYLLYAQNRYPHAQFIQLPHYAVYSYIRGGYMGCECNEKQKQYSLSELTEIVRERTGVEWVCYGFKQSDSLNRRLMLRTYEKNAINEKTKKFYPLSEFLYSDMLKYILDTGLIHPEQYGAAQSSGTDIGDINYLIWLRNNYPNDLQKIILNYPLVERLLFEYDYEKTKGK